MSAFGREPTRIIRLYETHVLGEEEVVVGSTGEFTEFPENPRSLRCWDMNDFPDIPQFGGAKSWECHLDLHLVAPHGWDRLSSR